MTNVENILYLIIALAVAGWGFWKERNYTPGNPPLVPYMYIQITAMFFVIALCAHLFSTTTGITWDPPGSK